MIWRYGKKGILFLTVSILLEVLVFNCRAVFSMGAGNRQLELERSGDTVTVTGMSGEPGYLYVGLQSRTADGGQLPLSFTLRIWDEGNADGYELAQTTVYPPVEKSKYLRVHSYGAITGLQITLDGASAEYGEITEVVYDARVPFFVSPVRIAVVFAALCLIWLLRPASGVWAWEWKKWQKRLSVGTILLLNAGMLFVLVRSNPLFLDPPWPYHQQYALLAEALTRGETAIDMGNEELLSALAALENPYDANVRLRTVPDADQVWDTCYYEGRFYVYFGVVPALLFYLPCYLIFGSAFPTWFGVFLAGAGVLAGVFWLLRQICGRWFPKVPYVLYLLLSVIMGNGMLLACAMLRAEFYWLPILLALGFSLWGMGFALSAANRWEGRHVKLRLVMAGSCLALTAGCRPQFLVGSFLLLPVLGPLLWQDRREKRSLARLASLALPYALAAAGLMFYNNVRFGSVFDFGANYNLTTNDMTRRGMNLGRLWDGLFMYLFQPVNLTTVFPFGRATPFYSEYLGSTIRDSTYGGAFWSHPILLACLCLPGVSRSLRGKKAFGFTVISLTAALAVAAADTEMAGILNRYFMDFLWLLMIPAAIILFQLMETFTQSEKYRDTMAVKWLLSFVLLAGAAGILFELVMAVQNTGLQEDNAHLYYMLKAFFQ